MIIPYLKNSEKQKPDEGRSLQQPKHYEYNNQGERAGLNNNVR